MTESIQYGVIWEADPERPETWKPIPGASKYEVSDKGQVRRASDGYIFAQRKNNGYWRVNYYDDTGKRHSGATVHRLVLLTFEGPCPTGKESLHGKQGSLVNWWPENLRWGTKLENEADKGTSLVMIFDCIDGCGTKVRKESRRCPECVAAAGRKLGRMLDAGMNLEVAAVRLGYSSDWAYRIAVEHGCWTGSKRDARLQSPSVRQRLAITLRDRRPDGWGDSA